MKLTTITNVSVDGVMQGLGGQDEDRRGGFTRGGWALPLFDEEAEAFLGQIYAARRVRSCSAARPTRFLRDSWGTGAWGGDQGDNPISLALNTKPKYVVSTTLTDPTWTEHHRPLRRRCSSHPRAESPTRRRVAGARQRLPRPLVARS